MFEDSMFIISNRTLKSMLGYRPCGAMAARFTPNEKVPCSTRGSGIPKFFAQRYYRLFSTVANASCVGHARVIFRQRFVCHARATFSSRVGKLKVAVPCTSIPVQVPVVKVHECSPTFEMTLAGLERQKLLSLRAVDCRRERKNNLRT
jgi:hypothetical protein